MMLFFLLRCFYQVDSKVADDRLRHKNWEDLMPLHIDWSMGNIWKLRRNEMKWMKSCFILVEDQLCLWKSPEENYIKRNSWRKRDIQRNFRTLAVDIVLVNQTSGNFFLSKCKCCSIYCHIKRTCGDFICRYVNRILKIIVKNAFDVVVT